MDCLCCGYNQAVKTYYQTKNGKKQAEYYCLECYHRLFLSVDEAESGVSLSDCPYCGMKMSEIEKRKLVGCANCYKALRDTLVPLIVKMQQCEKAHRGKMPPLDGYDGDADVGLLQATDAFFEQKVSLARFERQCNELEIIIAKLKEEDNYEDAKGYADKLSTMLSKSTIEEEFVWRARRNSLKQS